MPSSLASQIGGIVRIVSVLSPNSILDIGPGFGKYGVLCREYLDINRCCKEATSYPPPWRTTIDCIEVWPQYVSPIHRYVYDNVFIGNAMEVLPRLGEHHYDLALVLDVLEHFAAEEAGQFMDLVLKVAWLAVVSVPRTEAPQEAAFGNDYERHRSHWPPGRLLGLAPAARIVESLSLANGGRICLLSSDQARLREAARIAERELWTLDRTALLEWLRVRRPLQWLFRRNVAAVPRAQMPQTPSVKG